MRRKLPLFWIFFVGALGGIFLGVHTFFHHGGLLKLDFLEPLYAPFFEKNGIKKAELSLFLDFSHHWVLAADKVIFEGGSIQSMQIQWGWHKSGFRVRHVGIDGLHVDLAALGREKKSEVFPLQPLLVALKTLPGSITRVTFSGVENLIKNALSAKGAGDFQGDAQGKTGRKNISISGTENILPPMDIHWEGGRVVMGPSLTKEDMGSFFDMVKPHPFALTSKEKPWWWPTKREKSTYPYAYHYSYPKLLALPPAPTFEGRSFQEKIPKNSIPDPFFPKSLGWERLSQDWPLGSPWATIEVDFTEFEGRIHFSWQPVFLDIRSLGVLHTGLQGHGKGEWKMHNNTLKSWSLTLDIQQVGRAHIPGTLLWPCPIPPISPTPPISLPEAPQALVSFAEHRSHPIPRKSPCRVEKTRMHGTISSQGLDLHLSTLINKAHMVGFLYRKGIQPATNFLERPKDLKETPPPPGEVQEIWRGEVSMDGGSLDMRTLEHLWPNLPSCTSPRQWILGNFHGGRISKARISFKSVGQAQGKNPSQSPEQGPWHFSGALDISDTSLSFMPDMPRIEAMDIQSLFDRQGFRITLSKGSLAKHVLKGTIGIAMDKSPITLHLDTHLSGPLDTLLPLLLRFAEAQNLGIKNITGLAKTHIYGSFPLTENLSAKDVALNLYSHIPEAGFDFPLGNHWAKIRKTDLCIDHKAEDSIRGKGEINGILTQWSWSKDTFLFSGQPSLKQLQEALQFKGNPSAYLDKSPKIRGQYTQSTLTLDLDFTPCACSLPWMGWKKTPGMPLRVLLTHAPKKSELSAKGSGVSAKIRAGYGEKPAIYGKVRLGPTFGKYVYTGEIPAPTLQDLLAALLKSGHHQLFFRTPKLILPKMGLPPQGGKKPKDSSEKTRSKKVKEALTSTRIDLDFACNQVSMTGITMDQVHLQLSGSAPTLWPTEGNFLSHYAWRNGLFYSTHRAKHVKRSKMGHVSLQWKDLGHEKIDVRADVVDLGSVCNGLGITQRIRGGDLRLKALQDGSGIYTGSIYIDGIKTKISALGKLLSIISPTMLTEMFSSGITFSQLDADFRYEPGLLKIINGVGKGLNLGLFVKGSIYTDPGRFKIQGVAVPSYLINTFFSRFPVIGWILGGNKGLISTKFTVTGPLNDPKIKTIPLSLFKFGFLKNLALFKKPKKSKVLQKREKAEKDKSSVQKNLPPLSPQRRLPISMKKIPSRGGARAYPLPRTTGGARSPRSLQK